MRHPVLIAFIWIIGFSFSITVWTSAHSFYESIEEMLWFCLALTLLAQYYPNRTSPLFLSGWALFCFGMTLDIADEFFEDSFAIFNIIDTSIKNAGFIMIGVAMLHMLRHKHNLIKQINQEMAEKELLQKKLQFEAYHDPLTALGNRRACFELFETQQETHSHLYYFDLDNFKTANDKHGHLVGDNILKLFAHAISKEFGAENCFRLGGDEFVAFGASIPITEQWREQLLNELKPFSVGASIGYVELRENVSADTLLNLADLQMYKDKSHKIFRSSRRH